MRHLMVHGLCINVDHVILVRKPIELSRRCYSVGFSG